MAKPFGPRGKRSRRPWRRRAAVEQLEPRLLLSADLPGEALDAALPAPYEPVDAAEVADAVGVRDAGGAASGQHASVRELVIIDAGVEDREKLLDDLRDRGVEVRLLDADRDGVQQIGEILAAHDHDLDAVHLVSHGTEQGVQLGGTWLTLESLPERAESLTAWRGALTQDADLLIYGCNLAASGEGQTLVDALSTLTGADVAASVDATGAALLGADWELEFTKGSIETATAFSTNLQETWSGLLAGSWFDPDTGAPLGGPTIGADLFVGDAGSDTSINAGDGDDVVYGNDGDDDLDGGKHNDLLLGGAGADTLTGSSGDDILLGGSGDDSLVGGSDADTLIGGGGNDFLSGGNEDDLFLFSGAQPGDVYTVDGGNHTNTIDLSEFGAGNVTLGSGTITVDLGGGQSFVINHTNVQNIVLAEDVGNRAAQADAGPDQAVTTNSPVALDASGSSDPDSDPLTYQWQQISGAWVTLDDPTAVSPTFTAPGSPGLLEFAVTVSDGQTSDVNVVQIGVLDASSSGSTPDQASVTVSHTTFGENRLMLVGVSMDPHGDSVSSITHNGVNLSFVGAEEIPGAHSRVEIWGLVAPDTGTHDVVVDLTGTSHRGVTVGVTTFTGVNQTTPLLAFSSASGRSTDASTTVASATDDLVFGVVHSHFGTDAVEGAGQTEQWDVVADQSNGSGTVEVGAASVDTSWTVNNDDWSVAAVSVQADTNFAEVASLSPVQDAYIQLKNPDTNEGTSGSMVVDRETTDLQRALVQFDLSSIPAGSIIQSATLRLEATNVDGDLNIEAYQVLESWVEGSTTWNERSSGTAWGTLGGSFNATALDSIAVAAQGPQVLDITTLAQDWVDGSQQNHGVLVGSPDGGANRTAIYDSREGTVAPVLEIVYTSSLNDAPTADAGGPYDIAEGDPVTLDASLSSDLDGDSLTYTWDIDGDMTYGDETGVSPNLGWGQLKDYGIDDDGAHTVSVRVDDGKGGFDTASATINVANTAPTLTVSGPDNVDEGAVYTLTLSATDPGDETRSWTIHWGDGTIDTVGDVPSATHVYTQGGFTRNITVSVTDEDGTWTPGDVFASSGLTDSLFRYDATSGTVLQEFGNLDGLNSPVDVEIGPDGLLYATGFASDDIQRYDPNTGAFVDVFVTANSGGLNSATRIAFGPDGHLYVTSYSTDEVLRFDGATGAFIDAFVTAGSGSLDQADGIAFGPDGNLYVASNGNARILRYDGASGAFMDVFATVGSSGYTNFEFGPDGNLYVANTTLNSVQRFDGNTGAKIDDFVAPGSGGISGAAGLVFGPDNNLYVVGWLSDNVLRYNATTGNFVNEFISSTGGQDNPVNLAFAPAQQVLVNHRADTPTVTAAVTNEDTQTSSGLVIDRSASDGAEVTHFKLTNITNGTLYQNDGSTVINDGDFISFGEGNAGLRFTPSLDYFGPASFDVQASTTGDDTDLSAAATASITVNAVNDAPSASDATFGLAENSADGTVVGSVSGSDVDAGDALSFAITGGDPSGAFAIDPATGEITVADSSQLDFETTPVYSLTVTVTDAGGLTDDATVTVNLTDVNEAPTASDATFGLAENSADGTVVGSVSASDVDAGDTLSWTITGGDPSGAFAIDAGTGEITVADSSQLDFETTPVYTLTVTVTDAGGLTDTATVTVNLTDVNEAPAATDASFGLAENSADGTVVGSVSASDVDAGDTLSWTITGGDPSGAFAIDAGTGEITVADSSQLDFETTPVYTLTVTVTDAGGLTDTATVTVNLTDVNEAPAASDATFSLAENSADGTVVGSVSASDVDAGDALGFAITGGDPTGAFAIDPATGEITVVDSPQLDFETTPVYSLTVTVSDAGGLTDTATVTVNLTDVNEAPTASDATFGLAENSADGTVVGSVSASDVDAGDTLSFAITGGDPTGAFAIDTGTGEITVNDAGQLDFETAPVYTLTVTVTDSGGLTDTATVTVNLTDVNEAPSATDATFGLAENSADGTVVGSVSASDVDAGDALSFAITGGDPTGAFAIDPATGEITVGDTSQLDFETTPAYTLTVTVTDSGGLTDTATVTVNLTDVNEAPTASDAVFGLAENSADGTVVGSVSASDVDAGDTLSYAITGGDPGSAFAIDSATGEITVGDSSQLDFETSPAFNLTITVTDAGGLTDTAAVTVNLTNVNEAPTASDAVFGLAENSADGTVVGSVSASDVDAGDTLSYAITGGDPSGAFAIDSGTGEITVGDSSQLDFETSPAFNLTVTVTDAGGLTDTAAVTVNLTNVNEAPTASDATFSLAENSADGTVVGSVSASDVDAGDTLSFAITGGDPGGAFAIDSATGEITVGDSSQLDFEAAPVYTLTVTVTDAGGLTDTATVTVNLTDVNEAPSATDATFSLAENSADGTVVGSVSASDVDAGDALSFAITGGDPSGAFAIDPATGEITVGDTSQLDFEAAPVYTLTVGVTDSGGLTDTATVTVNLTDLNEAPTASDATFGLAENSADGTVVGSVSASDVDAGDTLSFAITGGDPGGAFAIDSATGEITVGDSSQLDFEAAPVYTLTVTVTDAGGLTDTATVTVNLTDVNEAPSATDATFSLAENSADGTVVGSVSASDVDAGDALSFAITGGDPSGAFAIDPATGEITVGDTSQLDFEAAPVYTLTVGVTDSGGLTDTATVTVNLTDLNEAPTASDATFGLAENSADGTVVGSVSASDVDAGDTLSFAITGGDPSGAFAIDPATGEITVGDSSQLDFEAAPVYTLTVTVTDAGGLTDTATVTVNLTDVNEAPSATDATFSLAENSADGTVVGSVSASDVDAGDALSFAITGGDPSGAFAIDPATGEITVADAIQIDFETTPVFNLTVTVTDAGGLTDMASVTIDITAANDAPVLNPTGPTLPSITEDDRDNAGVLVSSILGPTVTDVDAGAVEGIAITSLASGNGTWQYQVGAGSWTNVGSVSDNHARLLQASDRIRFVPDGRNSDAASFAYRAWDQTTGATGARVNVSANGGATAYSIATDIASITVTAVNDAPGLGDAVLAALADGTADPSGESVVELFAGLVSDVDAGSGFEGIAVVGNGADGGAEGVWQYSTDGGASWFAIGAVGDNATALALHAGTVLRFVPAAGFDGAASALVVRGLDDTYAGGFSSTAGGSESRVNVDTASSGGTSAIAGSTANISTSLTAGEPEDTSVEEVPEEVDDPTTDPEPEIEPEEDPAPADEPSSSPVADTSLPDVSAPPPERLVVAAPEAGGGSSIDLSHRPDIQYDTRSDALSVARTAFGIFEKVFDDEALIVPGADLTDLIFEQNDFLQELDRLQEEIESFVGLEMTVAGSSIAVTMGLSIGYVIWLTRGGLLLASLLSSLPAWRLIDPIAVLAFVGTDEEDDEDEEESLDSMLRQSSSPEGSDPSKKDA